MQKMIKKLKSIDIRLILGGVEGDFIVFKTAATYRVLLYPFHFDAS
jgi:hypothetical protein